jgi:uncharacterized protein YbjQ (UPF0145 family)
VPFGIGKSDEEKAADDLAEREAEEAVAALSAGGLPPKAHRRLAELRASGDDAFFTSTLSVPEFLLAREDGLRPLTQVMGSSVYHVGWQSRGWSSGWRSEASHQELTNVAFSWNEARRLAFMRLEQEAMLAGAHAVVSVRVTSGKWDWANDAIEFVMTGTAVRAEGQPMPARPVLTDLSGQDYWKLREAGYEPVGVVGGTSSWLVRPSRDSRRAILGGVFSGYRNQEIPEFSHAMYYARQRALSLVYSQGQVLGANGVVGVSITDDHKLHRIERENSADDVYLIATMHVLGTAIVSRGEDRTPPVTPVMSMRWS